MGASYVFETSVSGVFGVGHLEWDGKTTEDRFVAEGFYVIELTAQDEVMGMTGRQVEVGLQIIY
jgi:hypothetical protein